MPGATLGTDIFAASSTGGSSGLSALFLSSFYGIGFDGDVTISTTVTLTRNMQYNNLTISGAGRLKPAGFRICVAGALTIDVGGSIDDDAPPNPTPSTSGTALTSRNIYGSPSGSGGAGIIIIGAGTGGTSSSNTSLNNSGVLPTGGAGGASGAGQAGGNSGSASAPSPAQDWSLNSILNMGRTTVPGIFGGGSGGGAGGNNTTGGSATSGAGGCGAGSVMVYAKLITNNGRISANGANGGAATITGTANSGGGGGGGGGLVFLQTTSQLWGTVQALGGTGGAGAGTLGVAGSNGTSGCVVVLVTS